jgi:hypothetical protein
MAKKNWLARASQRARVVDDRGLDGGRILAFLGGGGNGREQREGDSCRDPTIPLRHQLIHPMANVRWGRTAAAGQNVLLSADAARLPE